ncbi:Hypothetical protein, putative [Bodo saltans]|uniref:FPL domain-containing protein n=1 Tax=Bodo saltans TaxID=75058 RepID=A0A0S4JRP3_BODSA|nr:Hypothetical protein, putative [Bodo saltans]|eukprot:CUG92656.1 Hypothetical protein, putative [Bodo saltans]
MASNLFHSNSTRHKKFSAEHAVFLCDTIRRVRDDVSTQVKAAEDSGASVYIDTSGLVEHLRELVEIIVWGDKHDETVFFVLLEQSVMLMLEEMVLGAYTPSEVKVQVIQCVTILLQNLTNVQSVFSVCSNNHINRMLQVEVNPDDEELQSNYVSFLKTLCLRLTSQSVQFFFQQNRQIPSVPEDMSPRSCAAHMDAMFPLFGKAVKLLSSDEQMVRTAARQIVVTVLQLQDEGVRSFLSSVIRDVLEGLVGWVCDQVRSISRRITKRQELGKSAASSSSSSSKPVPWTTLGATDTIVEDLVDDFYYLNDLYVVPQEFVRPILLEAIRKRLITDVFAASIDSALGYDGSEATADTIAPSVSLLLLSHWFKVNELPDVHELLEGICFGEAAPRVVNVLNLETLVQCHPAALAVVQSYLGSKLVPDEKKLQIVRFGRTQRGSDTDTVTVDDAADTIAAAPSPPLHDPTLLEFSAIRALFGEYQVALQRGATYELDPSIKDVEHGDSLLHVLAHCITVLVRHAELLRIQALQFLLVSLLALSDQYGSKVQRWSMLHLRDSIVRAVITAQHSLVHRTETYRQHLWMMYGATGENTVLTPASLLCQLMRTNDRDIADPLEIVFARLERDASSIVEAFGGPLLRMNDWTTTKAGRDVALACPLMPPLACWKVALVPYLSGDIKVPERFVNEYLDMQQRAMSNVPLHRRTAQDEDEVEYVEVAAWVLLRHVLFRGVLKCEDPLFASLKMFEAKRHTRSEVRAWELSSTVTSPGVRCEFTPDHQDTTPAGADATAPPLLPGSVLYLYVDGGDIFFVEPFKDPAKVNVGSIVFSLRALYSEALIHNKQLFRLIVVQETPQASTRVSIVVRDRTVAQRVAQCIQGAAALAKHNAAALVWRLLMDDPLRARTNIFLES